MTVGENNNIFKSFRKECDTYCKTNDVTCNAECGPHTCQIKKVRSNLNVNLPL